MSHLDGPRIAFSGRCLGDVPTVNNTPAAFAPGAPPPDASRNWNPGGAGTFDLLDCRVTGGESAPGEPLAPDDPAVGLAVLGAADRASAKMVDLDPTWQQSTELWGLAVRLVDQGGREEMLSGSFRVAPFRDVSRRLPLGGAAGLGASFTSVLDDVAFGPGADASAALDALRRAAPTPRLSIVLNVFGFVLDHVEDRFTTGSVTGCIGPWRPGEPLRFVAGRRLASGGLEGVDGSPSFVLGPSVAAVDRVASRLVIDLGNAYPLADPTGAPIALPVETAAGTVEAIEVGMLPAQGGGAPTVLATVDLAQAPAQAGVLSLPLPPGTAADAAQRPLALLARLADDNRTVLCRETRDGLYVRADEFVHRIDAGADATTTLHATQWGEPAAGVTVHLASRNGAGSVLSFPPSVVTGPDGTATVAMTAGDPATPLNAVDGVVEQVGYAPRLAPDGSPDYAGTGLNPGLDVVVAHVRDAYQVPADPEWERDVAPVLAQYAQLYPVMREHFVDLADPKAVGSWRAAMLLAMTRDIADPNHMPVTRDLSGPKRAMIIRWLERLPPVDGGMARQVQRSRPLRAAVAAPPGAEAGPDAKTRAADDAVRQALAATAAGPDEE